ncbi:hypothetical protein IMG5_000800 [Ichthyophthirius multifiliis]|uniref:Cleavage and polyadenylation specificity factor subunit 2 n=1 Tax=Ichthyophthirius multifiliis TaxID=5932 RepID=G0QIW7_ICHMU|nr:hypothetical protein IMG5_000800 [Ichthyophthirius multifiliis]EGR34852.1 hypothetical protein IMG5_000800 [Ichthyophthirius multifiliis]|eukprot:XP_004040156.1 hypothetical protein IMG5_000800 [Ichthyophthirius multifiliis]
MKIEVIPIYNYKIDGATSTLLIFDQDIHILLDCGLNQKMDFTNYQKNIHLLKNIDLILLSHSGSEFTGALPFILSNQQIQQQGKSIQIYTTTPIIKLGLINSFNQFLNASYFSNNQDIIQQSEQIFKKFYTTFDRCQDIKFFQKKVVRIKQKDLIISPIGIGNSLGACAWKINIKLINVLYMIQYNHLNECHLDGLEIKKIIKSRIDVLIIEDHLIQNSQQQYVISNKANLQNLKDTLLNSIENCILNNSILVISSYPNERVIEIILILWQLWNEQKYYQ